jgi:adhesin transport system outer membrane protein
MVKSFRRMILATTAAVALLAAGEASAVSLKDSIAISIDANPEIGQAIENREAIQFELRQAAGLYLPSVDVEGSVGARRLNSPGRRALGIDDDTLYPADIGVTATQNIFDGYERRGELERQAARVDGASFRVLERSEFIALQVTREYFEILLQHRIIASTRQNVAFHRQILGDISAGESSGSLTAADRQQAQERLFAARAQLKQAEEDLASAKIRFNHIVGVPVGTATLPPSVAHALPRSLQDGIGTARKNNPRIKIATADIDAAAALVKKARAGYYPKLFLEGRASTGSDVDGVEGHTDDLQGRVVMKWNIFRGGIDVANEQEQIRRTSEERLKLHQVHRFVEEAVRISWERKHRQRELAGIYGQQLNTNIQLVSSYRQQFNVGQRSLLDVLDAQNSRFNSAVLRDTAVYTSRFADWRLLAATGTLLDTLGLSAPEQDVAIAREEVGVPATPPAETYRRTKPADGAPLDLLKVLSPGN